MAVLNAATRRLIESGALAHLVTVNQDGSAQVSVVWVGVDGDELVAAHLDERQRKLTNIRRDPRVVLSFEGEASNDIGMRHHCVVYGLARITEGGGPELLQRLAQTLRRTRHGLPTVSRPADWLRHAHHADPDQRRRPLDRVAAVPAGT